MDIKDFKIAAITEISKAIVSNTPGGRLSLLLQFYLKNRLKIHKAKLISLLKTNEEIAFCYGFSETEVFPEIVELQNIKTVAEGVKKFPQFDVVLPIKTSEKIGAFLLLSSDEAANHLVNPIIKNLNFIETISQLVLMAIENQQLQIENLEAEKINHELKLAFEIQKLLIPEHIKETKQYQVNSVYQPIHGVGGDYFDFVPFGQHKFFFCMADISGKGISAALVMAHFQAHVKLLVHHKMKLKPMVESLNSFMYNFTKGDFFVTFFGGLADLKEQKITYVNAAHFPVFLKYSEEIIELSSNTSGLGMHETLIEFEEKTVNLNQVQTIVAYTDGVLDVSNKKGQFLGDGFYKMVASLPVELDINYAAQLLDEIEKFSKNGSKEDDLTILSILLKQAFLNDTPQ